MELGGFIEGIIEGFPTLLVLVYLVIRQDQRIDELVKRIDDCNEKTQDQK